MKALVIKDGGLPEGIKWDDLKKSVRKVKKEGENKYWCDEAWSGRESVLKLRRQ